MHRPATWSPALPVRYGGPPGLRRFPACQPAKPWCGVHRLGPQAAYEEHARMPLAWLLQTTPAEQLD
ncbi:hypothetical protein [Micromonospora avicenniae]|uniref:hypothetical protein n=1 Tax=Micromonospora avicenniae TaxID=1198245 RepID=UPI0011158BE4|nr:hypothetical protein [Micromonospora avicenniae]